MSGSFRPPRSPNIIWPSLSSSIIIHYGRQWPEILTRPKKTQKTQPQGSMEILHCRLICNVVVLCQLSVNMLTLWTVAARGVVTEGLGFESKLRGKVKLSLSIKMYFEVNTNKKQLKENKCTHKKWKHCIYIFLYLMGLSSVSIRTLLTVLNYRTSNDPLFVRFEVNFLLRIYSPLY